MAATERKLQSECTGRSELSMVLDETCPEIDNTYLMSCRLQSQASRKLQTTLHGTLRIQKHKSKSHKRTQLISKSEKVNLDTDEVNLTSRRLQAGSCSSHSNQSHLRETRWLRRQTRWRHQLLQALMSLAVCILFTTSASGMHMVEKLVGSNATLPCEAPILPSSKVVMTLWYKEPIRRTIYAFVSNTTVVRGHHTLTGDLLAGDRATFYPLTEPPTLVLKKITLKDEAIYRCEGYVEWVSYTYYTNLTVIEPPEKPTIIYSAGKPINHTDVTYPEGATVDLTCQVKGGKPSPTVSWYWDDALLDDTHDSSGTGVVRNRLLFGPLTRNHTNARMVCLASSHIKLVEPVTTIFWINVQFKPTSVKIVSEDAPLTVGETYRLQCQSVGAAPPAQLSWYLQGEQLTNSSLYQIYDQVTDGSMSLSTLTLSPLIQDKEKQLQCRAQSTVINHTPMVDSRRLSIYYMGNVNLSVQAPTSEVVEGSNVVMRCDVDANPAPVLIVWKLKKGTENVLVEGVQGRHLNLTNVTRESTGMYTCVATSVVREGTSNTHWLEVNYKPTCKESGVMMIGTGLSERVRLPCRITSSPDPTSYRWQLDSKGKMIDIPERQVTADGQMSVLNYVPKTKGDYGKLLCWASNSIGEQDLPCRFKLVTAVLPTPLTNCTPSNNDTHTINIDCQGGSDNGLQETFIAEMYDITTDRLLRNSTNNEPNFSFEDLEPGSGYTIIAYTSNIRGPSEKFQFHAFTKQLVIKPMGILAGIVGGVVLMALIVVVVMKLKSSKRPNDNKLKCGEPSIMMPLDEQDYDPHRYGKGGGGKTTLINFPSEQPTATIVCVKPATELAQEPSASTPLNPNTPINDVEYAELEFATEKKKPKNKKKKSKKKKKEMVDEETEYASIDHVRTLLNSKERKSADASTQQDEGNSPLVSVDQPTEEQDDRIVLPDGALESSV